MTLTPGTRLDGYEILGPLGAGGMGEVYRARDPVLKREVAIKVLPAYVSQDPERLRRFEQEAQAAAALNHPNILAVYRFGTFEGAPYLVSELLEGGTLGRQLAHGPLPVRKAIDYGGQIAGGLAAAHEKGIVHRDLKPENIFVTKDGRVKILDFGLAKLTQARPTTPDGPTITLNEPTGAGHVLGTVGYMSPEQVRGVVVDHRADIFAFGAILYEMLAGKRAFRKPTSAETLTAILHEDPPGISQLAPATSPALLRIVHRCLEKNPEQRFHSASDLAFALEALSDSGKVAEPGFPLVADSASQGERGPQDTIGKLPPVASESGSRVPDLKPATPWWKRNAAIAVAACLVIAGLLYPLIVPQIERLWRLRELQQLTVVPLTALLGNVASPTFSPDGSQVAFAWDDGKGGNQFDVYVKVIGTEKLLRLTNKPGVYYAAWSPNGQSIAIERAATNQADSGVYLLSPLGGPEKKITNQCVYPFVAIGAIAWSPDGKQLVCVTFTSPTTSALLLLGIDSQQVVPLKTDCKRPISPAFSPDGVYLAWICSEILGGSGSIQLQRLGDDRSTQLLKRADGVGKAVWSEDGRRMVFTAPILAGDIWEVSLGNPNDPEKLPVGHDASDVTVSSKAKRLAFAQSRTNVNIWRLELGAIEKHARMVIASTREQRAPDISPNGDQVAFESNRSGSNEVWVSDPEGSNAFQLSSFGIRLTGSPRWSPDGKLIAFDSRAGGESNIYLVDPHSGIPHRLEIDIQGNSQPSWSHDGTWIYFVNGEDVQHPTGWKVSSTGGHAVPIADGPVMQPIESPDGLLVYFVRDSSLYSVTIDGMTAEKVEGMPFVFVGGWTPVESGFYFIGNHAGMPGIEFFDLKTRDFRVVYVLEKPLPGWVGRLPVSSDGKWLLFPQQDEQSSDLMLVENWR